jgi:hypothetical protein
VKSPAAVLLSLLLPLAGCGIQVKQESSGPPTVAEPEVSDWQTWVIDSPEPFVAPPAPPGSERRPGSASADGSPDEPLGAGWIELAMDYVSQRTKDPPAASRAYALVAVAQYDALVAARRSSIEGAVYADEAAVAGAATRVLAYLFPEQSALRLDRMAEDTAGGGGDPGLALGRAVADRVIAFARQDGSDLTWKGTGRPDRPGTWAPPPGSVSPPVQPLAGTWRTWAISSGDAFRPPPPPAYGSPEYLAEAEELVEMRRNLTEEQERIAKFWEGGEGTSLPPGNWNRVAIDYLEANPTSRAEHVRTLALVNVALADAGVASWDAKYAYWTARPENAIRELVDPNWTPYLKTPLFPAYVSGHSTYSAAVAAVMAGLFPKDAQHFVAMAEEAGMSRLLGGIHWRSDHVAGARMGAEIGRRVVDRAHEMLGEGDD